MSEGMNRVMLLGNLGADPELRFTQSGQAVLNMRLATTESWFEKDSNERKEKTEWHQVVLWGKRGEALAKFLTKGASIMVEGRLQTSSYEKDGQKHYKTEVNASNVILCGGKREGGGESRQDEDQPRQAAAAPTQRPPQRSDDRRPAPPPQTRQAPASTGKEVLGY